MFSNTRQPPAALAIAALLCGLLAVVSSAQEDKVKQDASLQSAKEWVESMIQKVRSQKGYRAKFQSKTEIPNSDPLKMEGSITAVNPDTVYVKYEGSGGQKREIIRKGANVLMRHPLFNEEWVAPEVLGEPGIAKGVQNPDSVFKLLANHLKNAELKGNEIVNGKTYKKAALEFKSKEIQELLAEQSIEVDAIAWSESSLSASIFISEKEGLLHHISLEARLKSTKEELKNQSPIKYSASIKILDYGTGLELKEVPDEVKKEVGIK